VSRPAPLSAEERQLGYLRVLEARDPTAPPARLRVLVRDPLTPVRLWAARNPSTPPDALGVLTHDVESMVRWYAMRNRKTSGAALALVASHEAERYGDGRLWVRSLIVHHPNLPEPARVAAVAAGACGCPGECYSKDVFG
jgi:Leucine rich repeat variant